MRTIALILFLSIPIVVVAGEAVVVAHFVWKLW